VANPSENSVSTRTAKYANAVRRGELSPDAAAKESLKIDESRLYLLTRVGDDTTAESIGAWRKRASLLEHLQYAVDTGRLVGGVPRVLIDPTFADKLLGRPSLAQLTLDER
jgi:hypothetical protein